MTKSPAVVLEDGAAESSPIAGGGRAKHISPPVGLPNLSFSLAAMSPDEAGVRGRRGRGMIDRGRERISRYLSSCYLLACLVCTFMGIEASKETTEGRRESFI